MPTPALHAHIEGRVQGVFFRAHTRDEAIRLRIRGWVRNLPDGRVEVYAVGPEADLRELLDWLHEGPPAAQVEGVEFEWGEGEAALSGFEITG